MSNIDRLYIQKKISLRWEERSSQSLTQALINRFNQKGVSYCHWKSKSLKGESDIDFLVSHHSLALAIEVLMQLGFKAATPIWGSNQPGVFHFYGYDTNQDDYVHLHMFTRVLSGETFVKQHFFPFEEMLFKDTYSIDGLVVTSKEAEFVLFILKTFIRYGSFLDTIRERGRDEKIKEEIYYFKVGIDMTKVMDYISDYCPVVDEAFFLECIAALEQGISYPRKWILAQKMRWHMRIYSQHNSIGRWMGYVRFIGAALLRKLKKQTGNKILVTGGTIFAIVGADATGKSTLVEAASRWLQRVFVVNTVHAGKPPSALLTFPINLLLNLNRSFKRKLRPSRKWKKISSSNEFEGRADDKNQKSLVFALRAVCLAWDRRTLLLKARRASTNGEIIVCDRYPTHAAGMMDGPRLVEDADHKGLIKSIYNWLARVERTIYRQIPPPDIVIRLKVSLETAKKRNASREIVDDEIYLQNRHQQVEDWFVTGACTICDIDTDQSLEETIAAVKEVVWSSL